MRYDGDGVARKAGFVQHLKLTKGEPVPVPFMLRPFQHAFLEDVFGPVGPDGRRIVRNALLAIPRKNGKTQVAAAIALAMLMADDEHEAQIYSASIDRETAGLIFRDLCSFIRADPDLDALCNIVSTKKMIEYKPTNSFYRALSADAFRQHGLNPHAVILDEFHTIKSQEMVDVLTTSMGARKQPLFIAISTAGHDKNSPYYNFYEYCKKVRDGVIEDPSTVAHIYELEQDEDWTDPEMWRKANPALGDYRNMDEFENAFRRAKESPVFEAAFRQLYLNQWTDASSPWLSVAQWDALAEPDFDESLLRGRRCYGGLDLARVHDLSAFVLAFEPTEEDPVVRLMCWFWLPDENMRRRAMRDRVPYPLWVQQGYIDTTPGNTTDYKFIRAGILEICAKYNVVDVAYDRTFAGELVQELLDEGIEMIGFGQGYLSMTTPTNEFERLILSEGLRHNGSPVLRWNVANSVVTRDPAGNVKPDKAKSTERIDGVVAAIMALGRLIVGEKPQTSYYKHTKELLVL